MCQFEYLVRIRNHCQSGDNGQLTNSSPKNVEVQCNLACHLVVTLRSQIACCVLIKRPNHVIYAYAYGAKHAEKAEDAGGDSPIFAYRHTPPYKIYSSV